MFVTRAVQQPDSDEETGSALCNCDFNLGDVLKGFGTHTWLRHSRHTVEQIKEDLELKRARLWRMLGYLLHFGLVPFRKNGRKDSVSVYRHR